jgi:hypothetical protein
MESYHRQDCGVNGKVSVPAYLCPASHGQPHGQCQVDIAMADIETGLDRKC